MPASETLANVMMRRRMCTWHFRNFCTGNTLQMAIYIRQALDAQKKALSQSLRLVSASILRTRPSRHQIQENRDQKTPQAGQGIGRKAGPWHNEHRLARTVSIFSFLEAGQDKNGAGREVTPNDESNETSGQRHTPPLFTMRPAETTGTSGPPAPPRLTLHPPMSAPQHLPQTTCQ